MNPQWIALACPDLPVQVFTRCDADDTPLAVIAGAPRMQVIAANTSARARGIRLGENPSAARALAPDVVLRERDEALETTTLAELAAWAGRFSPAVSITPPDTVLIEVSASLRLFGGLSRLLGSLQKELRCFGLEARLASAPTPLAAHWLALEKPGTVLKSTPDWAMALDSLPLHVTRAGSSVSSATIELLTEIGIHDIGAARRLPRDGLARRQASEFTQTLARARGERPDPRPRHQPPPRHDARLVLPVPMSNVEPLLFAASRLVTGLAAWLDSLQAVCDRFELRLEYETGPASTVEIVSSSPSRDAARLMLLTREHLSAQTLSAPVESLHLSANSPSARPGHTSDLFGDPGQVRENAALLLDRLRARLGDEALQHLSLHPDHRPEHAWRVTSGASSAYGTGTASARPVWLLETPRRLPSVRGLHLVAGPERIESGWWDEHDIRRDYYVAQTREQALWWIFRDLEGERGWYVHGHFG